MVQCSSEVDSRSAGHKVRRVVLNHVVAHRIDNIPPLDPVLSLSNCLQS